ncbi:hypothetical protein [Mucilaginibacter sp.]|uniref:hypothetical protein n=1 Tax=Mucilaginibacter sp. TaxID=1882438 RepID=UPI003B00FA4C
MFKRIIAISLLAVLISSNFSRFFVYAGFELNKKYIAENLCINKARPWLHCNGKCYLMKKVKQAEENEKKQTAKDNLNRQEISFCSELFSLDFPQPIALNFRKKPYSAYNYQYSSRYIETIFRPPKQAA